MTRLSVRLCDVGTLKSIYFACILSKMKCGVIFWGKPFNSKRIFTLQKKTIRIMAGAKARNWCRSLFKKLEFLPILVNIYFH
jgi:hypothetical protein